MLYCQINKPRFILKIELSTFKSILLKKQLMERTQSGLKVSITANKLVINFFSFTVTFTRLV